MSSGRDRDGLKPPYWALYLLLLQTIRRGAVHRAAVGFSTVLLFCVLSFQACVARQHSRWFRVVPSSPNYMLQSPDSQETAFTDVLRAYNGFEPAKSWIDLRPLMELRIENAYYEKGASRRGLAGFLGTEIAQYEVMPGGLRLLSVQPMKDRPESELPVQQLIRDAELGFRYYRFYFEILFNRNSGAHGSAILGANSTEEIDRLSAELTQPEAVCNAASIHCAAFPEACSVSIEMKIIVNGKPQVVGWRSLLESVAAHPRHLEVKRLYAGQLTPIKIDSRDPAALRLPLLPGDRITWN